MPPPLALGPAPISHVLPLYVYGLDLYIWLLLGAAYDRMRLADRPYVICEPFCNLFACKASNFVFCLFNKDN